MLLDMFLLNFFSDLIFYLYMIKFQVSTSRLFPYMVLSFQWRGLHGPTRTSIVITIGVRVGS